MPYPTPVMALCNTRVLCIALLIASLSITLVAHARNGQNFLPELVISENGETHRLTFTGEAERVFLLFQIYKVAHYAEIAGRPPLSLDTVVSDGRGKAMLIRFDRKLSLERIRDEFSASLQRNAQPEWLAKAESTVADFIGAIDRDVRAGDELVFYWLAGGRLYVEFNGERSFSASNAAFAKLIWSIWFGDDPVCDRKGLLANVTSEADR